MKNYFVIFMSFKIRRIKFYLTDFALVPSDEFKFNGYADLKSVKQNISNDIKY